MSKPFYITTAIDYANGAPHLGHAYEKVLADVIARYKRMQGETVFFLTGLDEHGQKVQQSAEREGIEPQALCDRVAFSFKALCEQLNVTYDHYVRTTDAAHKACVQAILQTLYDEGHIYKADYSGFYSVRTEQFVQEKDKNEDGTWPSDLGEVVQVKESNYFFKLSAHQDWLVEHIRSNPDFIFPQFRANEVLSFLEQPLNDLCISRPKSRLSWGIELPFDSDYVSYVWFDALLNYLSASGWGTEASVWPANQHVIGKDILVPPHAVYWPIMLKVIGVPIPERIVVHGWWTLKGEKMSKSTGTGVNPLQLAEEYGADTFRYFVMREMVVGQDSDFIPSNLRQRYQSELGNDLGNLISRLVNMVGRYAEGVIPSETLQEAPEKALRAQWTQSRDKALEAYDQLQFHLALEHSFEFIRSVNRYAETRAPWKLAKDANSQAQLNTTLAHMAEGIRLSTLLLSPVMPAKMAQAHEVLGTELPSTWMDQLDWSSSLSGASVGEKAILFPRIETEALA